MTAGRGRRERAGGGRLRGERRAVCGGDGEEEERVGGRGTGRP